jgi:hypothetical protein
VGTPLSFTSATAPPSGTKNSGSLGSRTRMEMYGIPRDEVILFLSDHGGRLLDVTENKAVAQLDQFSVLCDQIICVASSKESVGKRKVLAKFCKSAPKKKTSPWDRQSGDWRSQGNQGTVYRVPPRSILAFQTRRFHAYPRETCSRVGFRNDGASDRGMTGKNSHRAPNPVKRDCPEGQSVWGMTSPDCRSCRLCSAILFRSS